jgi:quercetin dioxygenase-like cupin family protein
MDAKFNDATHNRPWGERPIDANLVPIDLHAYAQEIMQEEAWQKNDRNAITVFKTDNITIVLVGLHKDAEIKPGNLESAAIINLQVLEGRVTFSTTLEKLELNRGQMVVLHEHIPYSVLAQEETICLLTLTK